MIFKGFYGIHIAMTKFKFERHAPEHTLEKAISSGAQKMKTMITNPEEKFRVTPDVVKKSVTVASDMEDKYNVKVKPEAILEKSLEMLNIELGALPKSLQDEYIDLIAKRMTDRVIEGENPYQLLKEEMTKLKKRGIDLDSKIVQEKMEKKIERLAA